MITLAKLRGLEDERFYGLLDVVLDIRGELDFGANGKLSVPLMRYLVRYSVLLPAATPSMMDRYCELRWKALKYLESEGYLGDVTHVDMYGLSRSEDRVSFVIDNMTDFYSLAVLLTEEEERRDPGNSGVEDMPSAMVRVEQLCDSFHAVALKLQARPTGRTGLAIEDEYDVQYLLGALLVTRFSDVRPEETTPSQAGKSARIDFLLKKEAVLVETKMIRAGLTDAKLGDELIVDIERYKKHPDCKALFCFVYDPEHKLKNPTALEADLSRKTDGLLVRVRIRPVR